MRGGEPPGERLGTRDLRLLTLAAAGSGFALWAFGVVLALAAYRAGGAATVALAVVARVLPGALAGPFVDERAGGERRQRVLVALAGAATAVLAALALTTAPDSSTALLLALAAAMSILASGQQHGQVTALVDLARNPRAREHAGSVRQHVADLACCAGALAGAAAAGSSLAAGFGVAAAGSAAALVALAVIARGGRAQRAQPAGRGAPGSGAAARTAAGLRAVRDAPELRAALLVLASTGVVIGLLDVLVVVVALDLVGLGTTGAGLLYAAWAAGLLGGGVVALAVLGRLRASSATDLAVALVAVALALVALLASAAAAALGLVAAGIGCALALAAGRMAVQHAPSAELVAAASAVAQRGSQAAVALGAALTVPLVASLGTRGAVLAAALVLPLVVIARWRVVQRLDAPAAPAPGAAGRA